MHPALHRLSSLKLILYCRHREKSRIRLSSFVRVNGKKYKHDNSDTRNKQGPLKYSAATGYLYVKKLVTCNSVEVSGIVDQTLHSLFFPPSFVHFSS
jgi:hypothetical protein